MTPFGDDPGEMDVTDPVLADFLTEMRALVDVAAPPPSDELEALFASPVPLSQRGRPGSRPRPIAAQLLTLPAAAAAVVVLLVLGAATHQLPAPAQRVVSNVVNAVTPFHIAPDEQPAPSRSTEHPHPGAARAPRPAPPSQPAAAAVPNRPVSGAPTSSGPPASRTAAPAPQRPGTSTAGSAAPGKALGHGKPHNDAPGAAHGRSSVRGQRGRPGREGRTRRHGGPTPSAPPSAAPGHSTGSADGPSDAPSGELIAQYTKSVRNALPKQRSGSLAAASARKSSSRG